MKYSNNFFLMLCALFILILMGFVAQPITARKGPRPPIRPEEQSRSSSSHISHSGGNNQRKKASGKP